MATTYTYWCKLRGNRPVILFRMSADDGEQVFRSNGWQAAPGSYEDILEGSFDYVPIGEGNAREFFPEGFADG
jgi:hypothetical protein